MIAYNPGNKELSTVPEEFRKKGQGVLAMIWKIDEGSDVAPGTEILEVQWRDNSRQGLSAPQGCSGRVEWVNRRIDYENLPYPPAQGLLGLG